MYNLIGGYASWIDNNLPYIEGSNINLSNCKSYSLDYVNKTIDSSKNIIVVFKTPWCLPCKRLDSVLDVFSINYPAWNLLNINMDVNKNIAKEYNVKSVPTTLIYRNDSIIYKHIGYLDYSSISEKVSF